NVLRFNGASDDAMFTGTTTTIQPWLTQKSQPLTYAMVVKVTSATPSGTCPIIGGRTTTSTNNSHSIYVNGSASGPWSVNAGTAYTGGENNANSQYMTVIVRVNGGSSNIRVNGIGHSGSAGSQPSEGMV